MKHRIFVIDDNPRFPRFVYRKVTAAIELDSPGAEEPRTTQKGEATHTWESPDGRFCVVWIDTRQQDASRVSYFEERLKAGDAETVQWAVIDVQLQRPHLGSSLAGKMAAAFLRLPRDEERLFVVSSYFEQYLPVPGRAPVRVRPKTPELLEHLRNAIEKWERDRRLAPPAPRGSAVYQILITGAGFELKPEPTSGINLFRFGMPDTADLIQNMARYANEGIAGQVRASEPAQPERSAPPERLELETPESNGGRKAYPMPRCVSPETLKQALRKAAINRNLDVYWDLVFSNTQKRLATEPNDDGPKYETTDRIADEELRLRHAFRLAIREHDIGFLEQAIWAAREDWDVWLTTNYTGFSDRAIELCAALRDSSRRWMTIANPVEAAVLQRPSILSREVPTGRPRILIKLHGDIGQVHTMAIAGYDKQPQSPLFVRPELHILYAAATELLTQEAVERTDCWWHIVGHSLWDDALGCLIERVVTRSPACRHHFTLVGPRSENAKDRLRNVYLKEILEKSADRITLLATSLDAQQYLARLKSNPVRGSADPTMQDWLRDLEAST